MLYERSLNIDFIPFTILKQQQSLVICRQLCFMPNNFLHQLSILGMSPRLSWGIRLYSTPPPVCPFFSLLLLCNPRSQTFCLTWFQIASFQLKRFKHLHACICICGDAFFLIANCGLWVCFLVCYRVCGFGFLPLMDRLHFCFLLS